MTLIRRIVLCFFLCLLSGAVASHAQVRRPAVKPTKPATESAATAITPQRKKAQDEFLSVIERFLSDKNVAIAREGFSRVIQIDPTYPQPRFNLGVLAEAENNRVEAIKWFTEYLEFDRSSRYAVAARAKIARLQLAANPVAAKRQQYDDYLIRARRLINAGLLREAVAEFAQAVKLDDSRWEAYALTSVVLTQEGLMAEAKQFEDKARQRTPALKKQALEAVLRNNNQEREYRTLSQTGLKDFRAKNYIRAAEEFSRAWSLFPQRSEPAFAAAVAFTAGKDLVEAAIILNRLKTNPDATVAQKAERMLQALTKK